MKASKQTFTVRKWPKDGAASSSLSAAVPLMVLVPVLVLVLTLAACSDNSNDTGAESVSRTQATAVRPLLAKDVSVLVAELDSVPADYGARTRKGLYVQREQALQLERQLRGDVVWVPVECCGTEGADLAVYIAYGMQAAHNLPASAPVFVSGADLRLAASVVNRLADGGMSRVFLVTPPRTAAKPELR